MSLDSSATRFYRSQRHKVLGGVCSGIAIHKNWSVALVRLAMLFLFSTGLGVLLYLILWVLVPSASHKPIPEPVTLAHDPLVRIKNDRIIGGVCGGIARLLGWDPLIVRVVFIGLIF